jgi:hypothetical protein
VGIVFSTGKIHIGLAYLIEKNLDKAEPVSVVLELIKQVF